MKKETKDIFMYALAAYSTTGFTILCVMLFIVTVPKENHDIAIMLLGQFAAIEVMVYNYFFGSSKSSSDKTEAVNDAAKELAKNSVTKSVDNTVTNITPTQNI